MEHVTTVLIADSADDFCTALTAALQHADGFQVVGTANDGEQAIRMVEERKPDVLVLDLMLSKKDGISVLKAVSGMERRPITLATSVFVTQYVSAAAANLGVRYLMLKPCDMTALVERLEEIRGGDGQKFILEPTAPKKAVIGDVNADGAFNIADVVLLQKWLIAVPNVVLIDWKEGDLCEDDRLNVFDLCLMKSTLMEQRLS